MYSCRFIVMERGMTLVRFLTGISLLEIIFMVVLTLLLSWFFCYWWFCYYYYCTDTMFWCIRLLNYNISQAYMHNYWSPGLLWSVWMMQFVRHTRCLCIILYYIRKLFKDILVFTWWIMPPEPLQLAVKCSPKTSYSVL